MEKSNKRKFEFSAKTEAMKEIQAWGKDYGSLTDGSMRSAGQLTDNVTEARLLQNKIMDMSRDRYKYMTQAEYKKKFFIHQQQRKTKLMPNLLDKVDVEMWLSKKAAKYVPKKTSSPTNARLAFLERLESAGERCKDFNQPNPEQLETKPKIQQPALPEFYRIRLAEQEEEQKQKTFATQPVLCQSLVQKTVTFDQKAAPREVSLPMVKASQLPSRLRSEVEDNGMIITPRRRIQSCPTKQKITDDPRYKGLEYALYEPVTSTKDTDFILQIIDKRDSLHIPSKHSTIKPKLQRQIIEFLKHKGIVK